jgi:hypothetical protein
MKKACHICLSLLLFCSAATGQDRIFTRTYQSNILPKGVLELEFWNTLRTGRSQFHRQLDHRMEFEMGLGRNVQTAFYLNVHSRTELVGDSLLDTRSYTGFSNEWKVKLTDPSIHSFGTALYGEIGVEGNELEFETKFILDKQSGRNLFAMNLISEIEYEYEYDVETRSMDHEIETPLSLTLAYLRFIGSSYGIGFEASNYNDLEEREWNNSVWYLGPTFHVRGTNWWINVNVQPQLFNARISPESPKRIDDVHYDRVDARVIVSFTL